MIKILIIFISLFCLVPAMAQQKENRGVSILCPPPNYPKESRKLEEEGAVILQIRVNKDATVGSITVEQSSGFQRLDAAAMELIPNCQINPALRDSEPYDSSTRLRFNFKLEGKNSKIQSNPIDGDKNRLETGNPLINPSAPRAPPAPPAPSASLTYTQRITQKIKSYIIAPVNGIESNLSADVEIKCAEDGNIIGVRLFESSGNKIWDETVLKATIRVISIPFDNAGRVPPVLIIRLKPKD